MTKLNTISHEPLSYENITSKISFKNKYLHSFSYITILQQVNSYNTYNTITI